MTSLKTTDELQQLLTAVARQEIGVDQAAQQLQQQQTIDDLGFAKVDLSRQQRNGYPEVIYGAGKTAEQIIGIIGSLKQHAENILCTRVSPAKFALIQQVEPTAQYYEMAQCIVLTVKAIPQTTTTIAVVTAGTSDMAVAEEAALTAEVYGNRVNRIYDVGVAGIHRLFEHLDEIRQAQVVIVVAGMEGALASVVGGLIDRPLIAVPTSIGYGTNFGWLTALMTMLNSCASGITVVNIDNGFGAGYAASMMNHLNSGEKN